MFDQWAHVVCTEELTQLLPIVALVTQQYLQVLGVPPSDLHPDLCIVCLPCRAVKIKYCL
jgi:hypothetical protein